MIPRCRGRGLAGLLLLLLAAAGPRSVAYAATGEFAQASHGGPSGEDEGSLSRGKTIERKVGQGQVHTYAIKLEAGQYVQIAVVPRGLEVSLALRGPKGNALAEAQNPAGSPRSERILVIAEISGEHRLELRLAASGPTTGRYEVTVEELRAATSSDTCRVAAAHALEEGDRLAQEATAASLSGAVARLEDALQLWRTGEDLAGEGRTLEDFGWVYFLLGDKPKALQYLTDSLSLMEAVGDRYGEGHTLNRIGAVYDTLGEKRKAIDYYSRSILIRRALSDVSGEATVLNNLGGVYDDLGEKQKAIASLREALPLWAVAGDRYGEAATRNVLGVVYDTLGEKAVALEYYEEALRLRREIRDLRGVEETLRNIGNLFASVGQLQQALDSYRMALPLTRQTAARSDEANTLSDIGSVYAALGEPQKALDYYRQALVLQRSEDDRWGEPETLSAAGDAYASLGETQKAIDSLRAALEAERTVENRPEEVNTLNRLGRLYVSVGDFQGAFDTFGQALSLARTVGDRSGEALALAGLGAVSAVQGDPQQALEDLGQALLLTRAVGDRRSEAATLFDIARSERARGDLARARTGIERALDIIESLRATLLGEALRTAYFASVQENYAFYIDLLMQLHQQDPSRGFDALGFLAAERGRARGLLELLAEAGSDIRQGVNPALLDRERSLRWAIPAKRGRQTRLLSGEHNDEETAALAREIAEMESEYDEIEAQVRATSPQYAALIQPTPLTLGEIQSQVLDVDTLLLEFALGEERSFLWALTRSDMRSFLLPGRREIESAARRVYDGLVRGQSARLSERKRLQRDMTRLSEMVLRPAARFMSVKRIVIVADGALQFVPFGVLPLPAPAAASGSASVLLATHEVVSLPSVSALAALRREIEGRARSPMTLAVFADPVFDTNDPRVRSGLKARKASGVEKPVDADASALTRSVRDVGLGKGEVHLTRLPFTRREANEIIALAAPGQWKLALDFDANRKTATSGELFRYRFVHFATHGFLDTVRPELSGLVFSLVDRDGHEQDGYLLASEVLDLKLSADLVVLSACRTALGKEVRGEGLVGLTRAFMYAGAPRIVASLWRVDDAATAELMKRFYEGMLGPKKLRPAAALREAQLAVARQKRWREPYYWAAFVLQGEWN